MELTKAAVANVHGSEQSGETGGFTTLGTIYQLVFPSKRQVINSYPELEENPWKLPVCWVRRWLKYFKYRKLFNGNFVAESLKISKHRIELLKNMIYYKGQPMRNRLLFEVEYIDCCDLYCKGMKIYEEARRGGR